MATEEQSKSSNVNNNVTLEHEVQIKVDQEELDEYRELDKDTKQVTSKSSKSSRNQDKESSSKDNSKSSTGSKSETKQSSDREKPTKDKSKDHKEKETNKEKETKKDSVRGSSPTRQKEKDRPHKKSSVSDRRRRSTSRGRVRSPERKPVVGGDRRDRGFKRGGGIRGGFRRNFSPDRNRRSSSRDNKRRSRPYSPQSRSPIRRSPDVVRHHIMGRGGGNSGGVVNDMLHRNRLDMNRDRIRPIDRGLGSIREPPLYMSSQHDLIRRQREEIERLAREQRQLLIEREKFEREKAQFLRAERERTAAERERLARDREELASKRQTSQYGLSSKDDSNRMIPSIGRDRDSSEVEAGGYNRNNQYRSYNNQGGSHIKSLDDQLDYNSPRYRSRRY